MIHAENDTIKMREALASVKMGQAHLSGNENRTSESLRDSFVMKPLQDSYQETTGLLSIDYRTLIKKLQDSYQETTGTPVKRLQDS